MTTTRHAHARRHRTGDPGPRPAAAGRPDSDRVANDTLIDLVRAAHLAPSSHNTQPWRFVIGTDTIELWADRRRALPINDPVDRELTISCGAALLNLRAAAAGHALAVDVDDDPDGDLLATIRVTSGDVDTTLASLAPMIPARHTTRATFAAPAVADGHVDALSNLLVAAAAAEGSMLVPLDRPARNQVVDLVADGDRAQFGDRAWRRELASWTRTARHGDGLPTPSVTAPITRLVVRSLDLGASTARTDRQLATNAPLLAVLATSADEPADWLAAGQALQRVLLTATGAGWQSGFLDQPCQVATLRARLRALLPAGAWPQVVVRLGPASPPLRPAPRRPLTDVMQVEEVAR